MRAAADEQIAVHFHAGIAESGNFFQKCNRIQYNTIADHTSAAFAQHAAGNQLQDESLAVDDDSMAGVMSAGIARHDGEFL